MVSSIELPAPSPPQPYGHEHKELYVTGVPTQPMVPSGQWSTGLCDCGDDFSNCCITWWCPCVTFGQIAEIIDKGNTSCAVHGAIYAILAYITRFQWIYSWVYRSKMRHQYMLPGGPCHDCIIHWCCEPCALCQEYRELRNRGFDMYLGWNGNMASQNHGVMVTPIAPAEMKR